jgi:predicted metal-binding membrane protein
LSVDACSSWRYGVGLGFHCTQCCAGLTAALLVTGIMNVPGMLAATAAITLERLAPADRRVPQLIGTVLLGAGLCLIGRASGFP